MITLLYNVAVYGSIGAVILLGYLLICSWFLATAVNTFNTLFLRNSTEVWRPDDAQSSSHGWNKVRPPSRTVPAPIPFVAKIVVLLNIGFLAGGTLGAMPLALGEPVPQSVGKLRAKQAVVAKGFVVGGLPLGVFAMGCMLTGMLPTSVVRAMMVAIFYHVMTMLVVAGVVAVAAAVGMPLATEFVRAIQAVR
ncbi:MAG: hypothetical protein ACRC7O_13215 [Fimbriiglobus sp.]